MSVGGVNLLSNMEGAVPGEESAELQSEVPDSVESIAKNGSGMEEEYQEIDPDQTSSPVQEATTIVTPEEDLEEPGIID